MKLALKLVTDLKNFTGMATFVHSITLLKWRASEMRKSFTKELNQAMGLRHRLGLAFLALFAPGRLLVAAMDGVLAAVNDLGDAELKRLLQELRE